MIKWHWSFKTALRDARRNKAPLLLILCIMAVGVSGVVALHGFRAALIEQMSEQTKELFSADMTVRLRGRFGEEHEEFLKQIPGERTRELQFTSMAVFPEIQKTRFVLVSAIGQGYPLYGALVTQPPTAAKELYATQQVLIDSSLAAQFNLSLGDTLRLGVKEFKISGIVSRIPGVVDMQGAIAPRVFISLPQVAETKLLRFGSRVRSVEYFKLPEAQSLDQITKQLASKASELYLRIDTRLSQKHRFINAVRNVTDFSRLVALVAVVLAAVGAASIAHVYINRRQKDIGVFRCLGASRNSILLLFFAQVVLAGFLGVLLGAALGMSFERLLPLAFRDFIPFEVNSSYSQFLGSIKAILFGSAIGLTSLIAFTLVPILRVGKLSPMCILRRDLESSKYSILEKTLFLICSLGVTLFSSYLITRSYKTSVVFSFSLLVVVMLLFLLAELGIWAVAKFRSTKGPFVLRQGIANISRPQNQTRVLLLVLGLGSFLVLSVSLFQDITLARIELLDIEKQPNTLALDVQSDQVSGVQSEMTRNSVEIVDTVPLVTMRLNAVKGVDVSTLLKDPSRKLSKWPLTRMYRSTYRSGLEQSEELVLGEMTPQVNKSQSVIPVTVAERIAKELQLGLGDRLSFDVEGVLIEVKVVGVRKVNWQQVKPNFFVVFPEGVLEEAPQTFVITARAKDPLTAAEFQRSLVDKFSNVSIIDLKLIQDSIQAVMNSLSLAARFLGLFCVSVAIVMLIAAVISTREQRVKEFQILKFHGASKRTILLISCIEFGLLSTVAVGFGALFAFIATSILSRRLFDRTILTIEPSSVYLGIGLILGGLTLSILASIGTYERPATELLR